MVLAISTIVAPVIGFDEPLKVSHFFWQTPSS